MRAMCRKPDAVTDQCRIKSPQPASHRQPPQNIFFKPVDTLQRSPTCGGGCPRCTPIQAKLKIDQPGDKYEQEADRVADLVMRSHEPTIHPKHQITPLVQRQAESSGVARGDLGLKGTGQPLPAATRDHFEAHFGQNFGAVRVHSDASGADAARKLNARAFTLGRQVVFGAGEYTPATREGKRLLAHELVHVVQQGGPRPQHLQRQPIPGSTDVEDLPSPDLGVPGVESAPPASGCTWPDLGPSSDRLDLEFAVNRSTLIAAQQDQVGQFVDDWEARGSNEEIEVDGYASTDGPDDYNLRLSRHRAQSVRAELVDRGVPGDMVDTTAHGETTAFCSPKANRRAVIRSLPSDPVPVIVPGLYGIPPGLTDAFCRGIFGGVSLSVDDVRVNGVNPGAELNLRVTSRPYLHLHARDDVTYEPRVTLHVSAFASLYSGMSASDFEAGIIQNVLQVTREFTYENGVVVRRQTLPPPPINDGDRIGGFPFISMFPPNVIRFKESGDSARPRLMDTPNDFAHLVLSDEPACFPGGGVIEQSPLAHMKVNDLFRTWVAVHHRPSGCMLAVHHIDWQPDWSVRVGAGQTPVYERNVTNVLEPDGDGSPKFLTGWPVANESDYKSCSAGSGIVAVDDDLEHFRRGSRRRKRS